MKRITGAVVLLIGLGGCLSPNAPSCQRDKKAPARSPVPGLPPGIAALSPTTPLPPPGALPSNPQWTPHPAHLGPRMPAPPPLPPGASLPTPIGAVPPTATGPYAAAPVPAALAQSVHSAAAPLSVISRTMPGRQEVKGPPALPRDMPMAATPRPEIKTPATIQQVGHVAMPGQPGAFAPAIVTAEPPLPPQSASVPPPAPAVKNGVPVPGGARPVKAGAPLIRLVNTKRITLNFQVQNVGQSGLSSVELWYTQDCKEWKKYDAPTQAHAYVVEVDEEGMYGFTLLARSGIGLSKDPPAAGDQPQVWVIVDLSKPDVELLEVTPSVTAKAQQVAFRWKASDKNLAHQAIALSYAEKEEGPWKVIATNVENSGKYLWQVPADAPAKFLVRIEATDLAGNVGRAQSTRPVLLDMMKPEVTITHVEAHTGQ